MAVGTNLSALWILIANGWMQNPVGAEFNYQTMRMEMVDFWAVVFNPDAQAKFVHTVSAGYVTGAMFVLSISSWYLLQEARRGVCQAQLPRRRGLRPGLGARVIVLGDESGYTVGEAQQTKLAAMEAMWETKPAPAGLHCHRLSQRSGAKERLGTADSLGDGPDRHTLARPGKFPASTRSRHKNRERIQRGIDGRHGARSPAQATATTRRRKQVFERHKHDLGFGLLLKKYVTRRDARPRPRSSSARSTTPCRG